MMDRSRYPEDWEEISRRIRFDVAKGQCQCTGQCGLHPGKRCEERNGEPAKWARGKVILTVAHYPDMDPANSADDNLLALCNRCHLRVDVDHHMANARATRNRRRLASQDALPMEVGHDH